MKTHFETEVCSRCRGTGKYSFCERFRDVCFKCKGNKVVLTKRGAAASAYLLSLCTKPAKELKVGDRIYTDSMTHSGSIFGYIATVTKIEPSYPLKSLYTKNGITTENETAMLTVYTEHSKYGTLGITGAYDRPCRVYDGDNSAKIAEALAYQATLTKSGTVRKGKI